MEQLYSIEEDRKESLLVVKDKSERHLLIFTNKKQKKTFCRQDLYYLNLFAVFNIDFAESPYFYMGFKILSPWWRLILSGKI